MAFGDDRKPLRRDGPGARKFAGQRHRLNSDPVAREDFVRRAKQSGAKSLRESARAGAIRERELRASEGPLTPWQWRVHTFESSEGRCIVSGARASNAHDRDFHAHHPLPKDELRRRELRAFVWDGRNGVWLAEVAHMAHENGEPIPGSKLPAGVWEFAAEMDGHGTQGDGPEWATALVERLHP